MHLASFLVDVVVILGKGLQKVMTMQLHLHILCVTGAYWRGDVTVAEWSPEDHMANLHAKLCLEALLRPHGPLVLERIQAVECGAYLHPTSFIYICCIHWGVMTADTAMHDKGGCPMSSEQRPKCIWSTLKRELKRHISCYLHPFLTIDGILPWVRVI